MCAALQFLRCIFSPFAFSLSLSWIIFSIAFAPQNTHTHVFSCMYVKQRAQYNRLLSMFFKKYNKSWTKVKTSHSVVFQYTLWMCLFFNLFIYWPAVSVFHSIFHIHIHIIVCRLKNFWALILILQSI